MAGIRLRLELDRVPLWRGNHVPVKQLTEDFAQYVYRLRLASTEVLVNAIENGLSLLTWSTETFAYADAWDESEQRYRGLQAGDRIRLAVDAGGLLVKPEIAVQQLDVARATKAAEPAQESERRPGDEKTERSRSRPTRPRRFYGSVRLNPARMTSDAGKVAEDVVQHLAGLVKGRVEVTLEVRAEVPDGIPESVERTVTENCRTLRFTNHGFEEA